jgi:hypothetical protein
MIRASGLFHVACWAHAQRKFVDAVKMNPKDGVRSRWSRAWMCCFGRSPRAATQSRARRNVPHCAANMAEKRVGRGGKLYLNMWSKLRRCFDHDASDRAGQKKLAARMQREVRTLAPDRVGRTGAEWRWRTGTNRHDVCLIGIFRNPQRSAACRPLVHLTKPPRNDKVVILSDALWWRRYGEDAGIVGRQIHVDNPALPSSP